jgi:hypothetical protein
MSKLREKMIRAMELINLSKHTQKTYLATLPGPFVNVFLHRSTGNRGITGFTEKCSIDWYYLR